MTPRRWKTLYYLIQFALPIGGGLIVIGLPRLRGETIGFWFELLDPSGMNLYLPLLFIAGIFVVPRILAWTVKRIFWMTHQCPSCDQRFAFISKHPGGRFWRLPWRFIDLTQCAHCATDLSAWSSSKRSA